MTHKPDDLKDLLHFYVFDDNATEQSVTDYSQCIVKPVQKGNASDFLKDSVHYGSLSALYNVWKNDNSPYIGFSIDGTLPRIDKEELFSFVKSGKSVLMIQSVNRPRTLLAEYRGMYYNYDFQVFRELLKKNYPLISEHAEKETLRSRKYYFPCAIMRKDIFRKFCIWLFPLLSETSGYCGEKVSKFQNKYLEHLTTFVFSIYIDFHLSKLSPTFVEQYYFSKPDEPKLPAFKSDGSVIEKAQELVDCGEPEKIALLLSEYEKSDKKFGQDTDYINLKKVFEDYKRGKRYYKKANLDINPDLKFHIGLQDVPKVSFHGEKKPKLLILKWNSFNNEDIMTAFERAGFDINYIQINDITFVDEPGNDDALNSYLDNHQFDVVFTTNYMSILAEACYTHKIPYLAWAYDSPTNLGDFSTIGFDTSHIFLFDSDETYFWREIQNQKNVHYLPLAVDCNRYDSMVMSDEQKEKYTSDISFVGGLYDTGLSEYMKYLSDYEKSLINAVADVNVGKYGSYSISDIINNCTNDWFGNKAFYDAVIEGEERSRDPIGKDESKISGRLSVLVNKMVTNKERLILISMLSNHYDFKLYSNKSHSVFKNVKECGIVDYYKEMPLVFKRSRINLNITLKTIRNAMPLRCLDIMGNHGFLLSNYQKDFDEHFKDGVNLALFNSLEEAYDKCGYYLSHETERAKIAEKGYETVKEYYNYSRAIEKMLRMAGLENMIRK